MSAYSIYLSYSAVNFQPEGRVISLSWNLVTWRKTSTFSMKDSSDLAWMENAESAPSDRPVFSASSSSATQISTTFSSLEPTK